MTTMFGVKGETSIYWEIKKDASILVIKVQTDFRLYS